MDDTGRTGLFAWATWSLKPSKRPGVIFSCYKVRFSLAANSKRWIIVPPTSNKKLRSKTRVFYASRNHTEWCAPIPVHILHIYRQVFILILYVSKYYITYLVPIKWDLLICIFKLYFVSNKIRMRIIHRRHLQSASSRIMVICYLVRYVL